MRKLLFILFFIILGIDTSIAQKYVVYKMSNEVNRVTRKGIKRLRQRDKLTPNDIVMIPFNTTLELFDKDSKKKYIIKTPGKGSVDEFIKDNRNETVALSSRLFRFMVAWMTSDTYARGEGYSDSGTITREEAKDSTVIIIQDNCK